MKDPRFDQLARQLAGYSMGVRQGSKVLLDMACTPDEMTIALIRAVRELGGIPFLRLSVPAINRELLKGATDEQYELISAHQLAEIKDMDCYLAIRGANNITETSDVSAEKMALAMKHMRKVMNYRVNETAWCVLRWPTPSMAQQAGMSTEAFEDFYFDVCLLDYKALVPAMEHLKGMMERTDRVRLVSPGTDLSFSIKGIPAIVCAGNLNIPDGEVYTAPVKDSVNGVLKYNCPTIYQGIAFDSVELEFKDGKIVRAEAGAKTAELNEILDSDDGARFIGEFAIGTNPRILNPMRDILFDEKIAGSIHFTPGQAYEEADNGNRSQVHWDMVLIQRSDYGGGEMYFDDVLVRKDGVFIDPALAALNPQY